MKILISAVGVTVLCFHSAAFAEPQKGMGAGSGMMNQQSGEMLHQQTMSQDMMREMTHLMTRMQELPFAPL